MSNKYLDQNGLLYLWQKIKAKFALATDLTTTNGNVSNLQTQVDGIVAQGGEPNVIETVKVNGTALSVTDKAVNVSVPTNNNQLTNGAGYQTASQVTTAVNGAVTITGIQVNGTAQTPTNKVVDISVPTNNNQLTNGAGYQTSSQVSTTVNNAVTITGIKVNGTTQTPTSKVVDIAVPTTVSQLSDASNYALKSDLTNMYKFKGSVATYANLPSTGQTAGDVYDVQADGANYAWTGSAWDSLGQIFSITSISNAEIDTIVAS